MIMQHQPTGQRSPRGLSDDMKTAAVILGCGTLFVVLFYPQYLWVLALYVGWGLIMFSTNRGLERALTMAGPGSVIGRSIVGALVAVAVGNVVIHTSDPVMLLLFAVCGLSAPVGYRIVNGRWQ